MRSRRRRVPHAGRLGSRRTSTGSGSACSEPTATSPRWSPTDTRACSSPSATTTPGSGCRRPSWRPADRWCARSARPPSSRPPHDVDDGVLVMPGAVVNAVARPRTRRHRQHARLRRPRLPDRRLRPRRTRGRHRPATSPSVRARSSASAPASRPAGRIGAWAIVGAGASVVARRRSRRDGGRRPGASTSPGSPLSDAPRILVVCTGNLCRSPLVEALLAPRPGRSGHRRRGLVGRARRPAGGAVPTAGSAASPASSVSTSTSTAAGPSPLADLRSGRPHPDDDERAVRAGAALDPSAAGRVVDPARRGVEGAGSSVGGRCRSPSG